MTQLDKKIEEMKDEIVREVQNVVKIKSVEENPQDGMPFGEGVYKALNYTLKLASDMGLKTKNMDNFVGYAEYGEGEEMIAVLGHLDVVPEGDGWKYPPYAAEIHDDKIYGRGTIDNKGPLIGALYALRALNELRLPISKRIRIIFGTNEETGSNCIKYYLDKGEEIPVAGFTPDAEYPIINGEKGIITCKYERDICTDGDVKIECIKGGIAPNVVPDYAEVVISAPKDKLECIKKQVLGKDGFEVEVKDGEDLKIKSYGVSAHGSTPEKGKNAISNLLILLEEFDIDGNMGEVIRFINKYINTEVNGQSLGVYMEDDISGKFILNLGTIQGNNNKISFELNMRYPVTKDYEDFKHILDGKFKEGNLRQVYLRHKKSLYVSPETNFIKKLQKVYEAKTGDVANLISIGGGTYAKAMPNVVAFGPIFKGQEMVEHKPNEYIEISHLIKNTEIMAEAMYELAK